MKLCTEDACVRVAAGSRQHSDCTFKWGAFGANNPDPLRLRRTVGCHCPDGPSSRATTGGVATAYNTNTKVGQPIAGAHIDKCAQQRRTQGANAFTTDVRFIVGSFIGSNDSARIRSSASESVGAVSFAFAIS